MTELSSRTERSLIQAVRRAEVQIEKRFERELEKIGITAASLNGAIVADPGGILWVVSTIPWCIEARIQVDGPEVCCTWCSAEIQLFRKLKSGGIGCENYRAHQLHGMKGSALLLSDGCGAEGPYPVVGRLTNVAAFNLTVIRRRAEYSARAEAWNKQHALQVLQGGKTA